MRPKAGCKSLPTRSTSTSDRFGLRSSSRTTPVDGDRRCHPHVQPGAVGWALQPDRLDKRLNVHGCMVVLPFCPGLGERTLPLGSPRPLRWPSPGRCHPLDTLLATHVRSVGASEHAPAKPSIHLWTMLDQWSPMDGRYASYTRELRGVSSPWTEGGGMLPDRTADVSRARRTGPSLAPRMHARLVRQDMTLRLR